MIDMLAVCTPLLVVLLLLVCLVVGAVLISEALFIEFNKIFQLINGENE